MKKKVIYSVLSVMIAVLCYGNQHNETQFALSVSLYQQSKYEQAYTVLQAIDPKNYMVWYNLGNCAYKKGDLQEALAYFRCARLALRGSGSNRTNYNIEVVEKKLGKNLQKLFINKISYLFDQMPLLIVQLIFLLAWCLLFFFIKNRNHGKKYRSLFFVATLFIALVSGIALGFKYYSINQRRGIVMKPQVTLFAGPDEQYHALNSLDQASHVIINDQRDNWFKVMSESGSGWVMQDSIMVV